MPMISSRSGSSARASGADPHTKHMAQATSQTVRRRTREQQPNAQRAIRYLILRQMIIPFTGKNGGKFIEHFPQSPRVVVDISSEDLPKVADNTAVVVSKQHYGYGVQLYRVL